MGNHYDAYEPSEEQEDSTNRIKNDGKRRGIGIIADRRTAGTTRIKEINNLLAFVRNGQKGSLNAHLI
jgi:hypothetical protein